MDRLDWVRKFRFDCGVELEFCENDIWRFEYMLGEVQPNFGMDGRTDAVIVFVLLTFVVSVIMFNTLIR